MAMIQFLRGTQAGLAVKETINGALYFTTDTHKIYMGTETGKQEFSAIEVVSAVGKLPSVATAIKGKFYYAEAENVFCFPYNGEWKQVNPDTGATSIEVVNGGGNAISAASYDASTRKITLTKGETFATPAVVDGKISDKVGELKIGDTTYDTVKAYVDQKTSGIATDASLSALTNRVTAAEGEIDVLQAATADGGTVSNAIKAAQTAADNAQAAADQAKADAAAAQSDIDALEGKVGTVADGKTVVSMIGDVETAYKAKDNELAASIKAISDDYLKSTDKTALQNSINTKVDKTDYNAKVTALETADTNLQTNIDNEAKTRKDADDAQVTRIAELETKITGLSGAMHFKGVKDSISTEGAEYKSGDVIIVGEKEYVFDGTKFVEFGDVSAEGERIAALETTVGNATSGLVKSVADNAAAIADEKTRAEAAEATNKGLAEAAQSAADDAQADVDAIKADYLKAADKTELQGNINGVSNRVKAIEDKNISNGANKVEASTTNGNIKIDGTETVVYTHPAEHAISEVTGLQSALDAKAAQTSLDTTNASVAANASAITALQTGKADKAITLAGYGITDAYMKTEVDALLTWGEF